MSRPLALARCRTQPIRDQAASSRLITLASSRHFAWKFRALQSQKVQRKHGASPRPMRRRTSVIAMLDSEFAGFPVGEQVVGSPQVAIVEQDRECTGRKRKKAAGPGPEQWRSAPPRATRGDVWLTHDYLRSGLSLPINWFISTGPGLYPTAERDRIDDPRRRLRRPPSSEHSFPLSSRASAHVPCVRDSRHAIR